MDAAALRALQAVLDRFDFVPCGSHAHHDPSDGAIVHYCPWCEADALEPDEPKHAETCALVKARTLLNSAQKSAQDEPYEIVAAATAAVREADRWFEKVGGSSRHWVRDCFLPMLEKHGLALTSALQAGRPEPPPLPYMVDRALNDIKGASSLDIARQIAGNVLHVYWQRSREGDRPPEARTPTWQPIATAPKVGDVLLRGPGYIRTGYWNPRRECWTGDSVVPLPPPTHWAPLPRNEPAPAPEEPQR